MLDGRDAASFYMRASYLLPWPARAADLMKAIIRT
jgi:hypothetical protein